MTAMLVGRRDARGPSTSGMPATPVWVIYTILAYYWVGSKVRSGFSIRCYRQSK